VRDRYQGWVEPGYEPVARQFAKLINVPGRGGGSFVVRDRERVVVNIWGGVADPETGRPFKRDTLALSFSTAKGVAATIIHRLADRGLLSYDDPVAAYWREFRAAGKARITVRQLLSHQAGLDHLAPVAPDLGGLLDYLGAEERLAALAPGSQPGTPAYHGITYGWLLAGLARAITGRGMEELVETEISEPLGIDGLHFGRPRTGTERLAATVGSFGRFAGLGPVGAARLPAWVPGRRALRALNVPDIAKAFAGPEPPVLETVMPSANGVFTAESLATLYSALGNLGCVDGRRLLSEETARKITKVQTRALDRNLLVPMAWRLGYHQAFVPQTWLPRAFGHYGYAGTGAWAEPSSGISVAFVSNRCYPVTAPFGDLALMRLSRLAVACSRRAVAGASGSPAEAPVVSLADQAAA
jgi:CubicO group peptidase (beta-lactamase class C family)